MASPSSQLSHADPCVGHNWYWFGCNLKSASEKADAGSRRVYFTSLTYGGTDQLTVSTVHLARELNVVNMMCSVLNPPCPFAHVLPVARDLGPAARTNALFLFSEPERPEVSLDRLFNVEATRECSSAQIVNGLSALRPAIPGARAVLRTHVVLPIRSYSGPLLSHTEATAMMALLANESLVRGGDGESERTLRVFSKAVDRFTRAAAAYATQTGLQLKITRFTLLPDILKQKGRPRSWSGGPEHACSPPGKDGLRSGCGQSLLRHIGDHEANGTLVAFIVTESSQQDDLPQIKAMRKYWRPEGSVDNKFVARMLDDERSVTECFPLATHYETAVGKLFASSGIELPVVAWQLRAEKLSLAYHRHGSSWYKRFQKSIQHQMHSVQLESRRCGVRTILLESDLLQPSSTMWQTMFPPALRKQGKHNERTYGIANLTEATAATLLGRLRDTLLQDLSVKDQAERRAQVVTTRSMLSSFRNSNLSSHPLETFVQASPLNVEKTLFAVSMLAHADFLVRSPLSSTFSGWANTIRIARGGKSKAGWGTEEGYKWWRCDIPSNVKLGRCRRGASKIYATPSLCEAKKP